MDHVLKDNLDMFATVYLDDILIFSKNEADHAEHLRWVLQQLRAHNLKAKRKKSAFGLPELYYLGHIIKNSCIMMDPQKVAAIVGWPDPTCKKELQAFLGMCNFYSKFVKGFATIAAPLHALLRKETPWTWESEQRDAIRKLKHALTSAPVLQMPDFSKPF